MNRLIDFAFYVTKKINILKLTNKNYVGMDNLLPNKMGITRSDYLPVTGTAIEFKKGDILIGNIRPYFKKIWLAEFDGGCSQDVLCIRTRGDMSSEYLYGLLAQDSFFDYDMKGSKGSKMPRGDKNHIMNFRVPSFDKKTNNKIGSIIVNIYKKIQYNNQINNNLANKVA